MPLETEITSVCDYGYTHKTKQQAIGSIPSKNWWETVFRIKV